MKRRLFTLVSACSLVLCLVSLGLLAAHIRRHLNWVVVSSHGYRLVAAGDEATLLRDEPFFLGYDRAGKPLIVQTSRSLIPGGGIPYSGIAFVSAIFPFLWLSLAKRRRTQMKLKRGLCLSCGYNLTGNSIGGCPECGTAVATKADARV